jgi:hypothetical protein
MAESMTVQVRRQLQKHQPKYRVYTAFSVTREEYARWKLAATAEHLPFSTWMIRIANEEVRRKAAPEKK